MFPPLVLVLQPPLGLPDHHLDPKQKEMCILGRTFVLVKISEFGLTGSPFDPGGPRGPGSPWINNIQYIITKVKIWNCV